MRAEVSPFAKMNQVFVGLDHRLFVYLLRVEKMWKRAEELLQTLVKNTRYDQLMYLWQSCLTIMNKLLAKMQRKLHIRNPLCTQL